MQWTEKEIEDFLFDDDDVLSTFKFRDVTPIDRQVNVGGYFIDILAKTGSGQLLVVEIKKEKAGEPDAVV